MKKRTVILAASLVGGAICICAAVIGMIVGFGGNSSQSQPAQSAMGTAENGFVVRSREETEIWISLPDEGDAHWINAGEDLKMLLQNLGYPVTLSYAQGDAQKQADQMVKAIEEGTDCLIVAAVDSTALYDAAQLAYQNRIPVVAYDRLLMDTEAVCYYVAYDYKAMGAAIAEAIVTKKSLAQAQSEESHTIELFMGSPESSNALLLYQGIMEVLQPYFDSGVLVSKSGRTAFEDTCVIDWDPGSVAMALKSYLMEYYSDDAPEILCTVSDSFADACIAILEEKGWSYENWPVITGMGATEAGTEHLQTGLQAMTVKTDLLALNERCVQTVDDMLTGKTPEVNDTQSCYNHVVIVPAYLCEFAPIMAEVSPSEIKPEEAATAPSATEQ
jgi:putative multiple sugar transport system substrate-binding protein